MNFSDKLKEIRKDKGLSQEQLAEKIGVSRQAITKWETGKGLPDIENMTILAEIFKMTIDELISGNAVPAAEEASGYLSETIYDIDCEKHFDIKIGTVNTISLTSGSDEKLHVRLKSEKIENLPEIFKIKLDESRNCLDVDCVGKNKISKFEAGESLNVELVLPEKYSDHCELAASAKKLEVTSLRIDHLEYDGSADQVIIKNSSGKLDFTSKSDLEITVDKISGKLSVYQMNAKTLLHIAESACPAVTNIGRKCTVVYMKNGEKTDFKAADSENEIKLNGTGSELVIDLK